MTSQKLNIDFFNNEDNLHSKKVALHPDTRKQEQMAQYSNIHRPDVGFVWNITDVVLRDTFKKSEIGEVILPFVVLRRMDCILEPYNKNVREQYEKFKDKIALEKLDPLLRKTAGGLKFYNTSRHTLLSLLDDAKNISVNFTNYMAGFNSEVRTIFECFQFEKVVARLNRNNLLYRMIQEIIQLDFSLETVDNHDMGYVFEVGPECEFFLFHTDDLGQPTTETEEKAGYFDLGPVDLGENARRDMVLTLEEMGIGVASSHHEVAPAQHEIDLTYEEGLKAADAIQTFRLAARTIAKRHGLFASFMPKPKTGQNGSGLHVNMSLSRDGQNIFYSAKDPKGLSKEAYYFIGGLLKHSRGMAAITNPTINSYKRLVPGFEAPIYIAWSESNRSPLVRIPASTKEHRRIELRCPDPSANPYLMLAVCLAAGLDGIRNQIEPPASIDANVFDLSQREKNELGIESLPGTLSEALDAFAADTYLGEVLGEHITETILSAGRRDYAEYSASVSAWEIAHYLNKI